MQQPIKIVRVIARLNVGGPAVQAILMTEEFRRRGYPSLLCTGEVPPGEKSMEYLAEARGVTPVKIAKMSRRIAPLMDLASLFRLTRVLLRERPTVLHTHTAKAGTLGRVAGILSRVPVRIHTFHGHVFEGYFPPLVSKFFLQIERILARYTDCIIAVSESQRFDLVERFRVAPAEKVITIPLGFELEDFLAVNGPSSKVRRQLNSEPEAPLLGWVGRLTAIKDPELFLAAALKLHQQMPKANFVVVGDGELRSRLEQNRELHELNGAARLLGPCKEMAEIFADLDIVVLTSKNEGTPLALLEGMAAGKPFVATRVGGVKDLVTGRGEKKNGFEVFENGILTERSPEAIAAALHFLITKPGLAKQLGSAGREFVRSTYSHRRLANDLELLYQKLSKAARAVEAQIPNSATKHAPEVFPEHPKD